MCRMNSLGVPSKYVLCCVTYRTLVLHWIILPPFLPEHAASDWPDATTFPSSIGVRPANTRRRLDSLQPLGPLTIVISPSVTLALRLVHRTVDCCDCSWGLLRPLLVGTGNVWGPERIIFWWLFGTENERFVIQNNGSVLESLLANCWVKIWILSVVSLIEAFSYGWISESPIKYCCRLQIG